MSSTASQTVSQTASQNLDRYLNQSKPLWNAIALLYTVLGYGIGVVLIVANSGWLNVLGVLLLCHSLITSAYLTHELVHGTVFADRQHNEITATVMLWLNGGCYFRFKDLTRLHIAHHIARADFSDIDFLKRLPAAIQKTIALLEGVHFPAVDYVQRWRSITAAFWCLQRQPDRFRTTLFLAMRSGLLALLAWVSWKAIALYFLAYTGMVITLRLMDAFQHTYETFDLGATVPKHDQHYERTYTFSTLISQRYPWLNLLTLNFGYHNAHHEVMRCPWYNLPALDQAIPDRDRVHYISFFDLLKNYHRFRTTRLAHQLEQALDETNHLDLDRLYGGVGYSFLVLPLCLKP